MIAALDRRLRRLPSAWLFWPLILGELALVLLACLTLLASREARLTVEARTQVLTLTVARGEVLDGWGELHPARVVTDAATCEAPTVTMDSQIAGPVTVTMQSGGGGELSIALENAGGLGTVTCNNLSKPAGTSLILTWAAAEAARLSLPFRGHLTLGGDINSGTPLHHLLLDGTVRVEASSAPFGKGQVTSEFRLYTGDRLYLSDGAEITPAVSHGIVTMDNGVMRATAHTTAAQAQVLHYGQGAFSGTGFAPSFWAKLQAQPEWALLLLILPILLSVVAQLQYYREIRTFGEVKGGREAA